MSILLVSMLYVHYYCLVSVHVLIWTMIWMRVLLYSKLIRLFLNLRHHEFEVAINEIGLYLTTTFSKLRYQHISSIFLQVNNRPTSLPKQWINQHIIPPQLSGGIVGISNASSPKIYRSPFHAWILEVQGSVVKARGRPTNRSIWKPQARQLPLQYGFRLTTMATTTPISVRHASMTKNPYRRRSSLCWFYLSTISSTTSKASRTSMCDISTTYKRSLLLAIPTLDLQGEPIIACPRSRRNENIW